MFTWQRLLGERVPSLWDRIEEIISKELCHYYAGHAPYVECWNVDESNKGEQLLEIGHMSLYYLQYDKAKV